MKSKIDLRQLTQDPEKRKNYLLKGKKLARGVSNGKQGLSLITIHVYREGLQAVADKLYDLGIPIPKINAIASKVHNFVVDLSEAASNNALDAMKAKVPVHYSRKSSSSAVLRNRHILLSDPEASLSGDSLRITTKVYVDTAPHVVSYRKKTVKADVLAEWKDLFKEKRTGPSIREGLFTNSSNEFSYDWIEEAQNDFDSKIPLILKSL